MVIVQQFDTFSFFGMQTFHEKEEKQTFLSSFNNSFPLKDILKQLLIR